MYFARVFNILQQPYPLNESRTNRIRRNLLFGLFVSFFLWAFEPFGLATIPSFEIHVVGYGLVTSGSMFFLNGLLMAIFPRFFTERAWTTGKEILVTMLHLAFIGMANTLYTALAIGGGWSLARLLYFEAVTVGVGIFPVAGSYMVNQWILEKRYREGAIALNADLNKAQPENGIAAASELLIKGENQDEVVQLQWNELLLVQAAENYVEVVYESVGQISNKVLRKSLKQLEAELTSYPALFRCHKSYIVNLQRVVRTSGNAQGYRLHLDANALEVPVSRSLNAALPALLHQHTRYAMKV